MRILLLIIGSCFLCQQACAQHLTYCDWKLILGESKMLIDELEKDILGLGDSTNTFESKDAIVEDAENLFSKEASVRSDIEPDPLRGQIVRGQKLDKPKAYLNNIDLFYEHLEVSYEDMQVSYMKLGERFKKPEITYEFRRILRGIGEDGKIYEDAVEREVSFHIDKKGGEWVPFINVMDYNSERFSSSEAINLINRVNAECRSEEAIALEAAAAAEETALETANEIAEEDINEIRNDETITAEQQAEAIRERELQREREIEERERALAELRRREAAEQKRLRLRARRKRLFQPTFFLGAYGWNQDIISIETNSGKDQSSFLTTLGGGIDLAYLKADFSLMIKDEALANRSIAQNGFPVDESTQADSVNVLAGSVVAGLPLMIGKEFVLFAGGGGMYSNYSFSDASDSDIGSFSQLAPIVQASLTWVLPERGGGVTLSYRQSFGAKYGDVGVFGLGFNYYPTKQR